jgi:hypothetical protein
MSCKDLRSSGMLRSVSCLLVSDVPGQTIGPTLKGQTVKEELLLDCLALEGRTDRFSRNVGNDLPIYAT